MKLQSENRRSYEAASLRSFFDHQIYHLQKLVTDLSKHIHTETSMTNEDKLIVESFVDASNKKIRAVHDYSHKLRGHVQSLYKHVLQVADEIPPPMILNPDAIRTNPLINALFVNSNDIETLLNSNGEVASFLHSQNNYQAPLLYALLTARKSEKRTLGFGMQGDMLVNDLPLETVNFSSHEIHKPCADKTELSSALKEYLFSRVEELIKQELTSRMTEQSLKSIHDSYESRLKSLANPDVYLQSLIEYLESPAKLLSIDKTHFKLNKLGIKIDSGDRQCANEFDIHELTWSDNSRNVILQIAFHLRESV